MSDRPVTECIPVDTPPPGDCMRWIPGGTFRMGDDNAYLEEAPAHAVAVSGFWIDAYVVTIANFAAFVTATGYRTVAELLRDLIANDTGTRVPVRDDFIVLSSNPEQAQKALERVFVMVKTLDAF